ncbi:zona pellucida protein AX 4 [Brachyhypopomus gauderio]|uniref:zona pellucida protein AX 4 n=1 Tax=Brachyhypopomus gauderio TaxID=698409 RepID=UPI00404392E4
MAFVYCSGGLLLLLIVSTLSDTEHAPQNFHVAEAGFETECRDRHFFVSVKMPPGSELHFEAVDAAGVHLITPQYGALCGYTVQAVLDRAILRASYFSCHTENENDETFSLAFRLIVVDRHGEETSANISKSCTLSLPWSPREVLCEENYMEVSVNRDLSCPYTGTLENDLAVGSAVSNWQILFEKDGQQSLVLSPERAVALGYLLMATTGRIVFRTGFGKPHTSVKMVDGVAVSEIHPIVLFRQKQTIRKMDLDAACALSEESSSDLEPYWNNSVTTNQFSLKMDLGSVIGVDGHLQNKQTTMDQGHSNRINAGTMERSIPYVPGEQFVKETFVKAGPHVTPRVLQLFTINQTVPEEGTFTVCLDNVPMDVVLVALELNGNYLPVLAAIQSGYISVITNPNDTHAYRTQIPFEDPAVMKLYLAEGTIEYSLDIKYTLRERASQEEPYYHFVSVVASIKDLFPPVISGWCNEDGISFGLKNMYDHMWEFGIGPYTLTQQLADSRGYIMTNDSQMLIMHIPLFTVGYIYENISLQQFIGAFEISTRNAKTLQIAQATSHHCLFKTTELLVCSSDGLMTVVTNVTKAFPMAVPAMTTLLDRSCKPREFDETRVLFSFKFNTCGTRVKLEKRFLVYENEILFYTSHSPENKPVITRDVPYKITVRCIYSAYGSRRLFVNRRLKAQTPAVTVPTGQKAQTQTKDEVFKLAPSMRPIYPAEATVTVKPASVYEAPVKYVYVSSRGLKKAKGVFQTAKGGT